MPLELVLYAIFVQQKLCLCVQHIEWKWDTIDKNFKIHTLNGVQSASSE